MLAASGRLGGQSGCCAQPPVAASVSFFVQALILSTSSGLLPTSAAASVVSFAADAVTAAASALAGSARTALSLTVDSQYEVVVADFFCLPMPFFLLLVECSRPLDAPRSHDVAAVVRETVAVLTQQAAYCHFGHA